jgi:hypothetical protein
VKSTGKKQLSRSIDQGKTKAPTADDDITPTQHFMDEEEMLDIAEHCFIKIAESLIEKNKTAR